MTRIRATVFSKKRNSTKRPTTFNETIDVKIKDNCSWMTPTFILNRNDFSYNYIRWGNQYYFVEDVTYLRNELIEVSCVTDVLATYKESILDSVQFVSYSNISGGTWLQDTRLPILNDSIVKKSEVQAPFISNGRTYILSTIGKSGGCGLYALGLGDVNRLLNNVQSQNNTIANELMDTDWSSTEECLKSLGNIITQTDLLGNAYQNAPSCIRSCFWTPLIVSAGNTARIYLGNYDTNVDGTKITGFPIVGSVSLSIPWRYADWRRGYCETIYLYLPFTGMINISSSEIVSNSTITIKYSYTLTDGAISYEVLAGDQVIGTYGGSCVGQFPIGINQQASIRDIATTLVSGAVKTANSAIFGSVPAVATGVNALATAYETLDTAYSTHPSSIGGLGGGSGSGLDLTIKCISVSHGSSLEPSQMMQTMGVPTMKPLQLSQCHGYVQCANAHVSTTAHSDEMNLIDSFLNSGFYIE